MYREFKGEKNTINRMENEDGGPSLSDPFLLLPSNCFSCGMKPSQCFYIYIYICIYKHGFPPQSEGINISTPG